MLNMNRIPRRYRQDIQNLTDGNLLCGETITMSLQEFGQYCERDQLKIAAYTGLSKFLQESYGITLHLTSRKTKGNVVDEENSAQKID